MNRRGFLKLLGGTVVATQLPIALLPTEERTGDYCVRYIRAYDVFKGRIVERVDVAMGGTLEIPKHLDNVYRVDNVSRPFIGRAIRTMKQANVPLEAIAALECEVRNLKPGDIISVDFSRASL
jgi:hypothetical protein